MFLFAGQLPVVSAHGPAAFCGDIKPRLDKLVDRHLHLVQYGKYRTCHRSREMDHALRIALFCFHDRVAVFLEIQGTVFGKRTNFLNDHCGVYFLDTR